MARKIRPRKFKIQLDATEISRISSSRRALDVLVSGRRLSARAKPLCV